MPPRECHHQPTKRVPCVDPVINGERGGWQGVLCTSTSKWRWLVVTVGAYEPARHGDTEGLAEERRGDLAAQQLSPIVQKAGGGAGHGGLLESAQWCLGSGT